MTSLIDLYLEDMLPLEGGPELVAKIKAAGLEQENISHATTLLLELTNVLKIDVQAASSIFDSYSQLPKSPWSGLPESPSSNLVKVLSEFSPATEESAKATASLISMGTTDSTLYPAFLRFSNIKPIFNWDELITILDHQLSKHRTNPAKTYLISAIGVAARKSTLTEEDADMLGQMLSFNEPASVLIGTLGTALTKQGGIERGILTKLASVAQKSPREYYSYCKDIAYLMNITGVENVTSFGLYPTFLFSDDAKVVHKGNLALGELVLYKESRREGVLSMFDELHNIDISDLIWYYAGSEDAVTIPSIANAKRSQYPNIAKDLSKPKLRSGIKSLPKCQESEEIRQYLHLDEVRKLVEIFGAESYAQGIFYYVLHYDPNTSSAQKLDEKTIVARASTLFRSSKTALDALEAAIPITNIGFYQYLHNVTLPEIKKTVIELGPTGSLPMIAPYINPKLDLTAKIGKELYPKLLATFGNIGSETQPLGKILYMILSGNLGTDAIMQEGVLDYMKSRESEIIRSWNMAGQGMLGLIERGKHLVTEDNLAIVEAARETGGYEAAHLIHKHSYRFTIIPPPVGEERVRLRLDPIKAIISYANDHPYHAGLGGQFDRRDIAPDVQEKLVDVFSNEVVLNSLIKTNHSADVYRAYSAAVALRGHVEDAVALAEAEILFQTRPDVNDLLSVRYDYDPLSTFNQYKNSIPAE
ncbi:MAG: hypothetical protein HGA85_08360, partial [Nanoarchaeota archaeon]|nr:hypothetical protein [Nanoarchaeota archaeon]